jgi:hypothetical protein
LLKVAASDRGAVRAAPVMTTFDGQRAYVKVTTQRAFVADRKVVRNSQGLITAYEPVVESAESGMTVDLRATVSSSDPKTVTLTIRPLLQKLLKLHTAPFAKLPADHPANLEKPTVQVPEMLTTEAEVTASVPDQQTLVLSAGEDQGVLAPDKYQPVPGRRLYVLVTPTVSAPPTAKGQ